MNVRDLRNIGRKLSQTAKGFEDAARYYYGDDRWRYVSFFYYSFFRVNTFLVFENILDKDLPVLELGPEFKIMKPTMEELQELRQGKTLPREFYYDDVCKARECYLVLCGQDLAYIHWVFFEGDYSRFFLFGADVAELNYNITMPRFRGRYLSAKVMAYISRDLKERGFRKAVGAIHEHNIASIKCIKRAGFREAFRIRALGQFNRKYSIS